MEAFTVVVGIVVAEVAEVATVESNWSWAISAERKNKLKY
jgi:hypothetical protein